jgi:hypothetical protein
MDYEKKYIKYKSKYLKLSKVNGGAISGKQNIQIILYNGGHFGDIFFVVEIVRNIVKCNPDLKISLMNNEDSYYLYSNVDNLELLPQEKLNEKTFGKFFIKYETIGDKLFINLHYGCAATCSWFFSQNYQCYSPFLLQNYMISIINEINSDKKLNINLKYDKLTENQLIPKLKLAKIPDSIEKHLTKFNKYIFYYNISPRMVNYQKIFHEEVITKLCNMFKEHLIIVPKNTNLEFKNLICLEKNGILKNSDGKNVVQYAQIARKCEHVIIYDSGICFPSLIDNHYKLYIVESFHKRILSLKLYPNFKSLFDLMKQDNIDKKLPKRIILGKEIFKVSI